MKESLGKGISGAHVLMSAPDVSLMLLYVHLSDYAWFMGVGLASVGMPEFGVTIAVDICHVP